MTEADQLASGAGEASSALHTVDMHIASGWNPVASIAVWLLPAMVALATGWWGIASANITRDETATIDIGSRSLPDLWRMIHHADAVHAPYYLLMHYWISGFGVGVLAIRIPSLVATVAAAALVAVLGRMLVSPRAGLSAGLLCACAPQMAFYAHDARSYGIDTTLVVLQVIVFVWASRSERRWPWLMYTAMVALCAFTHLFTLLIVLAQGVTVLIDARRTRSCQSIRRWFPASMVAALLVLPFARMAAAQGSTVSWIPRLSRSDVFTFGVAICGGAALVIPFAVLLGLAARRGRRRPSVIIVALPWLLIPPLFLFVGSTFHPLYVFRYLLFCLPALVLLVAGGLDRLPRWPHVIALIALLAATIPQQLAVRSPDLGANDFRAEAAYLAANEHAGDAVVFLIPGQRELAQSAPSVYARLYDVQLAHTPAQAASFSGTDLPTGQTLARLTAVNRVWAVTY